MPHPAFVLATGSRVPRHCSDNPTDSLHGCVHVRRYGTVQSFTPDWQACNPQYRASSARERHQPEPWTVTPATSVYYLGTGSQSDRSPCSHSGWQVQARLSDGVLPSSGLLQPDKLPCPMDDRSADDSEEVSAASTVPLLITLLKRRILALQGR